MTDETMPLWRRAMANREAQAMPRRERPCAGPDVLRVIDRIAREHDVRPAELLGRSRLKHIALARHHAMAVIRWSSTMSLPAIGHLFERDHTTVMSGIAKYDRWLNGDPS